MSDKSEDRARGALVFFASLRLVYAYDIKRWLAGPRASGTGMVILTEPFLTSLSVTASLDEGTRVLERRSVRSH
jgi:hypothetical protein